MVSSELVAVEIVVVVVTVEETRVVVMSDVDVSVTGIVVGERVTLEMFSIRARSACSCSSRWTPFSGSSGSGPDNSCGAN